MTPNESSNTVDLRGNVFHLNPVVKKQQVRENSHGQQTGGIKPGQQVKRVF